MPWVYYHTDQIAPMTRADYENNVTLIWNTLGSLGYTIEAVSAICGNMQAEGNLNPQQYEYNKNYDIYHYGAGLCGWTPVYDPDGLYLMNRLGSWCDSQGLNWLDGDSQLAYLDYELTNWNGIDRFKFAANQDATLIGYPAVSPMDSDQFPSSTLSVSTLTDYWLCYYERPRGQYLVDSQPVRQHNAAEWYAFIATLPPPTPPVPPTPTRRKMPLWLMIPRRRILY